MICEHEACTTTLIETPEILHSMLIVLQKVDTTGYQFYQCEEGQELNFVNYQHWHCSKPCMTQNLIKCLNEHYSEDKLHPIINGGSTIMHRIVLSSHLQCKVCNAALNHTAYRFCLTHATPINSVPDDSMNHLGEWCCSLDHAQKSAIAIIQNMETN